MMATKDSEQDKGKKKGRLGKIGKAILLLILIIVGFFLGIYLQIFDSDKMGLSNVPVIGQFFPKPAETESTVPDDTTAKQDDAAAKKKTPDKSKPVKLSQKEIDKLTQQRQAEEKKRVSKLARLYNEMKPEDAAKILETMDNDIVIAIFQRMDESQVSQILTEFDADRAAAISKIMYVGAPKRVQQVTNENGAAAQQQQQQMQ